MYKQINKKIERILIIRQVVVKIDMKVPTFRVGGIIKQKDIKISYIYVVDGQIERY